jgi:hypothetical protein
MPSPKTISTSEKNYRKVLWLYPASHRREFGEAMAQLFRDQCQDAWQAGRSAGLVKLWLRTVPDIGKTSVKEQFAAIERNSFMKHLKGKHAPTILLIASLVMAFMSFSHFIMPFRPAFMLLAMGAALAMLAKAGVELFLPGTEWLKIAIRTFILMFFYALILPAWAKLKLQASISTPVGHDPFGLMIMCCLFANPLVTAIKFVQFLVQRLKS